MLNFRLSEPSDWEALGSSWRELESRADAAFFRSWSWVGCRVAERFTAPLLLEGWLDGRLVALGLFNRRRHGLLPTRLWLSESGDPALDSIYVEHNGLVLERGVEARVLPAALQFLAGQHGHIVLSGVDEAHLAAARATGLLVHRRAYPASSPWIDLADIRAQRGGHLALLSGNTRQQIRRSLRRYGEAGALRIRRAENLAEAGSFMTALAALHQRTWTRRGKPGAFANPAFVAFHHDLLAAGWPRGEIDLLCVESGAQVIGVLYNFRWNGGVGNYQSGFDYDRAGQHEKPGLTCHHLAVEMYAAEGLASYDFLAGDHRYKTSLATALVTLHWIELMPPGSVPGLLHRARAVLSGQAAG